MPSSGRSGEAPSRGDTPAAAGHTSTSSRQPAPRGWATRLVAFARTVLEAIDPALSPRFLFGSIGGLLLGLLALVIYLRSGTSLQPVAVRLHGPTVGATASQPGDLRLSVAPVWSSHEDFEPYDDLARYLSARLDRRVIATQRRTQGEAVELVTRGQAQAAIVDEAAYLHALSRGAPLVALVVPVAGGDSLHRALTVVSVGSDAHALDDLRARSFAFTDPDSLTGYYEPLAALADADCGPGLAFFARTVFTYAGEESLRAVRNGVVDAASIDSAMLDSTLAAAPELRGALRVLHSSQPFGRGPLVVSTALPDALRARALSTLLHMHEDATGRAILTALHLDRFDAPAPDLYESAAQVLREEPSVVEARR